MRKSQESQPEVEVHRSELKELFDSIHVVLNNPINSMNIELLDISKSPPNTSAPELTSLTRNTNLIVMQDNKIKLLRKTP